MCCLTYIYIRCFLNFQNVSGIPVTVTVTVIVTVTMSLKSTDHKAHTYLLRKLQKKGMGVNEVEMLAKKSSGMEPRKEERRRRTVQLVMKGKLENAILVHRWSRESVRRKLAKVDPKWGNEKATFDYLQDHPDQRGRESLERREGQEQE